MKKSPPADFRKILQSISHAHSNRTVFDAFCLFAACALAMETREAEYLEESKRWKKDDLESFARAFAALTNEMDNRPFEDLLGGYYIDFAISEKDRRHTGEFHTPKPICDLMAQMTLGDMSHLPSDRPITVCEPACGAGAMILSVAQAVSPEIRRRLRVTAIDINRTACDMCFINTTLWGIPTRVLHGDTLAWKFHGAWSNIHWIMPWLPFALRSTASAQAEPVPLSPDNIVPFPEQGAPPSSEEVLMIQSSLGL